MRTNLKKEEALVELMDQLGLSLEDFGGKHNWTGGDPYIYSKHHIGDATSVLLSLFGMEIAAIWKARTGETEDVTVKVENSIPELGAIFYHAQNGYPVGYEDQGEVQTTDYFKCKDGRWVYIVCSVPQLRQKACAVLNCQATQTAFRENCMKWNALDLEEAMNEIGAACLMARTREEWFKTEQSKVVESMDLIQIDKIADSSPKEFSSDPHKPLSGLKVIDNTHIYAGPYGARCLADAGAEVLRLLSPTATNPVPMEMDTIPGKRSAWCDFKVPAHLEAFFELVKEADVFINSYLHVDQFGITPQRLAQINPHIIQVDLTAFGTEGPWASRGGFEQHGQAVTGFGVNEGSLDAPAQPPTYLLNDTMTGLEAAIGTLECIRRRAKDGGSYYVRTTLSRNCSWLQQFGLFEISDLEGLPKSIVNSPGLAATLSEEFMKPVVKVEGPLGEMQVLPIQVEFSSLKIQPEWSGDPNGASKLVWKS
jgi:crotonobetainyl-CoA:carnitine CoA-transferase CaiB-like acyl-CoA transferase